MMKKKNGFINGKILKGNSLYYSNDPSNRVCRQFSGPSGINRHMIKFSIIRTSSDYILPHTAKTTKKNLQELILKNIDPPSDGIQTILVKIKDKPIRRRLVKLFDMDENILNFKLECFFSEFSKKCMGSKQLKPILIKGKELDMLENGVNLAKERGSFVQRLLQRIKEAQNDFVKKGK